jgi:hypothetical protein
MSVALFKTQLRVSADRFEVAAVPLAAMQIRRVGLAATDAWQTSITSADVGVECLLSLGFVVTVRSEFSQSCFTALAPSFSDSRWRFTAWPSPLPGLLLSVLPIALAHSKLHTTCLRAGWNHSRQWAHLRRAGLRMWPPCSQA